MKGQSKFIKSRLCLATIGFSFIFACLYTGCKEGEEIIKINPDFEPAYLKLHQSGVLKKRGEELWNVMKSCNLCPRKCGADRLAGEKGFCQADSNLVVASHHPHFGEERPLVGKGGSGTKVSDEPEILFDILEEQKQRLEELRRYRWDYVSPYLVF